VEEKWKNLTYKHRNPHLTTLHQVLSKYWPAFEAFSTANGESVGVALKREIKKYLECGIYKHGVVRIKCVNNDCEHEKLLAFSCKTRGFCPSCYAKRSFQTAEHLVENVLPACSYRQYVLSFPVQLRWLLCRDKKIFKRVHRIVIQEIQGFYKSLENDGETGGVNFVQMFGSSCSFNLHFHLLLCDGVFLKATGGGRWLFREVELTKQDVDNILLRIIIRIARFLKKLGIDVEGEEELSAVVPRSIKVKSSDKIQLLAERKPRLLAEMDGFSLHAERRINALDRKGLRQLIEYQTRGPISEERLRVVKTGEIELKLKTRWKDGTTHIKMDPLSFIRRLSQIIPPTYLNMVRYFGFLAPASPSRRSLILNQTKKIKVKKDPTAITLVEDMEWAKLLAKVFKLDVAHCPRCSSKLRIVATIHREDEITRYLKHTGQMQTGPPEQIPTHFESTNDILSQIA